MTYTEVGVSPKSGFKKIVLKQKLVLVLNLDSQNTKVSSNCYFIFTCHKKCPREIFYIMLKLIKYYLYDSRNRAVLIEY